MQSRFDQTKKVVRSQSGLAEKLIALRIQLLATNQYTELLGNTRHDLTRIIHPRVAIVGALKAGKTTLLNALCGVESLLPTSPVPQTMIPTRVQYSDAESIILHLADGTTESLTDLSELARFVTATAGKVVFVDVSTPRIRDVPWQYLDTPGTNAEVVHVPVQESTRLLHEAMLTAEVYVLTISASSLLTESDAHQLRVLSLQSPASRLCVALSRADTLSPDVSMGKMVAEYLLGRMKELLPGRPIPRIIPTSLIHGRDSGATELEKHIGELVAEVQEERLQYEIDALHHALGAIKQASRFSLQHKNIDLVLQLASSEAEKVVRVRFHEIRIHLSQFAEEIIERMSASLPMQINKLVEPFVKELQQIIERAIFLAVNESVQVFDNKLRENLSHDDLQIFHQLDSKSAKALKLKTDLSNLRHSGQKPIASSMLAGSVLTANKLLMALVSPVAAVGIVAAGTAVLGSYFFIAFTKQTIRQRVAKPVISEYLEILVHSENESLEEIRRYCRFVSEAFQSHNQKDNLALKQIISGAAKSVEQIREELKQLSGRD